MKKAFLFIACIFLLSGCMRTNEENIPFVRVEKVDIQNETLNKTFQGYIKRSSDVYLSFNLSGIMTSRYVNDGDFAKKGELLARLDSEKYDLDVQKAKLELQDAAVKNSRAKSYFERISKLYKAGGISYNDWEAAQTDLKSSINNIEISKDNLKIALKQEGYTKIFAPYDGYVIKAYKDPYQYAEAGENVFYFQGLNGLEARIFVSEFDINNIEVGEKVLIKSDTSLNKTYEGKIKSKINSSLDKGSYEIRVSVKDDKNELLDGMSITALIGEVKENKKIYIPLLAVVSEKDKKFVYILNKTSENTGILTKKEVQTGEIIKDKILIVSGLNGGETIVTEGTNKVMDGIKVKFI